MKNLTYIIIGCAFLITSHLFGQQVPHYTQYMYNMNIINPAYVASRSDLTIGLLGRKQWVGVEGAPETQTFSISGRAFEGLGLGISVVHDKIGLAEETNFNADISYTIVTSSQTRLALGVKGGFSNFTNNLTQGITPDGDINPDLTGTYPNFGFGAFYYTKHFYVGLSIPQLLKTPKFRLDNNQYTSGISEDLHYFLTLGYVFELNEKVKFKPSTLLKKASGLPLQVDLNANLLYNNFIEFGISYRYHDAISAVVALSVNETIRVGYSYDYSLTNLSKFNTGSHEIVLLFDFNFKKRSRWLNNSSCYF